MHFFSASIILLQILTLAFIGGFARTTTFQSSLTSIGPMILFYLAWTILSSPYKKITLHSYTLLLIAAGIGF